MKRFILVIIVIVLFSCNSTQLIETWKNPEVTTYEPSKVLVVGLTSNLEARRNFENQLKSELQLRGIEAISSLEIFKPEKMTENDLKTLENNLIDSGFDTILFSKIIGVEDKIVYKKNYDGYDETYSKFREDYLKYQDVYYNPDYYNEYTVYHAETALYCICPTKDRSLLWKGYIDIVEPESAERTITNYVNLVILALEQEQLINPELLINDPIDDELIN
ncbi:hypothetical protein HNV10_15405 [Winogradskyella litoriviva]|uniref:Cardiolipin synthetase n=1 Tax=Winogradskyella litoriviva TaxID=1220182 RepID=A0ABX2E8T8_9FLAO|nr:hypothetical protein [Winogradskyella litoriviva]NRD24640.1 hypothetical protein [Winogradskyella litoriviva]